MYVRVYMYVCVCVCMCVCDCCAACTVSSLKSIVGFFVNAYNRIRIHKVCPSSLVGYDKSLIGYGKSLIGYNESLIRQVSDWLR